MKWLLYINLFFHAVDKLITLIKKHWPKKGLVITKKQGEVKMAEQAEIKELMELLDAIEIVAGTAKQVMADGKVNLDDLPAAMALLPQASKLVEAFKGLEALPAEIKDIREDEAIAIVKKLYAIGAKIEA